MRSTEHSHLIITVREHAMLKELVDILEPFAEATALTQGEKYATIGCVTPCVLGLYNCLCRMQQSSKYHGSVVRALMDSLQLRFGGLHTNIGLLDDHTLTVLLIYIYPMATIMDPNYGFVWLEDDLPVPMSVKDSLQKRLIDDVIKSAEDLCRESRGATGY